MAIIMYQGAKGAGKTFLMTRDLIKEQKASGYPIKANYQLQVKYRHFNLFTEIFGLTGHIIAIDEIQKLASCRRSDLPAPIEEMVAGDRHDLNVIYLSTQNFWHVDKRIRDNTDELIKVYKVFRFPPQQSRPALLQWSIYIECEKRETPSGLIRWRNKKVKHLFIHKWSEKLYNTYEKIYLANYKWRLKYKNGKGRLKIVSRHLLDTGRKRL